MKPSSGRLYLNQWKPLSTELYEFAAQVCEIYDKPYDGELRSYARIERWSYADAQRLGFDQDIKAWRRFVFDQRKD